LINCKIQFLFFFQGESTDNFNWGVRRRPLSEGETDQSLIPLEESLSEKTPILSKRSRVSNSPKKTTLQHLKLNLPIFFSVNI